MNFNKTHWIGATVIVILAIGIFIGFRSGPSESVSPSGDTTTLTVSTLDASSVEVGDLQKIGWTSDKYTPATIAVNIIRKVSDNPARYELVRTVTSATENDGSAVWVPAKADVGANTFVEVGCTVSAQACRSSVTSSALAVVDTGRFANTASVYDAIEKRENN
ncbi:MAG: hypothetical protein AAB381_03525 [Patescibacteria group bacterium]